MEGNDIVFWFTGIVSVFVIIWAILMIRLYDKIDKGNM